MDIVQLSVEIENSCNCISYIVNELLLQANRSGASPINCNLDFHRHILNWT